MHVANRLEFVARTGLPPFDEEELDAAVSQVLGDIQLVMTLQEIKQKEGDDGAARYLKSHPDMIAPLKQALSRELDLKDPTGRGRLHVRVKYLPLDRTTSIAALNKTEEGIDLILNTLSLEDISEYTLVHELVHAFDPKLTGKRDKSSRRELKKPWTERTHEQHAILIEILFELRGVLRNHELSDASPLKLKFLARNPNVVLDEFVTMDPIPRDKKFLRKLYRGISDLFMEEIASRRKKSQ